MVRQNGAERGRQRPSRRLHVAAETVNWPHERLNLWDDDGREVYLKADLADDITSAARLALRGNGYPTEEEAQRDGEAWLDRALIAPVDLMIGHDLRAGGPRSQITEAALKGADEADPEHQHFGEKTGVFVLRSEPPAVFNEITASAVGGLGGEDLLSKALAARDAGTRLDERLKLARDLYGAALFLTNDEARRIALVTAVESLIEQPMRPNAEIALLEGFVTEVRASDLEQNAKAQLANALDNLRRQSIRSAGKRLAESVGEKTYLGMTPGAFWSYAYTSRGNMSRGRPTGELAEQLRAASPAMQFYFRDLFLTTAQGSSATNS